MKAPTATEKLDDGQRAALDLGRDLLVSAGAGAGKTQVLGLRYVAILEEGLAGVPDIVAFTFTDKAAAEMRQRVQGLLLARSAELTGDPERSARLRQAQAEFSRNRISTIHGFCRRMLVDYAWEAGIEPRAPMLDERAQALARDAAIRRVLLKSVASDSPDLGRALVRLGSELRLGVLAQTLGRMLKERAAMREPLEHARQAWQDPDAEVARRRQLLDAMIEPALDAAIAAIERVDHAAASRARKGDKLAEHVNLLSGAAARRDVRHLRELLLTQDGQPAKPRGAQANWKHDPQALDRVREQVAEAGHMLAPAVEALDLAFDPAFERRAGLLACDLALVFEHASKAYTEECAGGLDFVDLELLSLQLLNRNSEVRAEVTRRARYLLIDEYQDTNPQQAELFSLLTGQDSTPGRFFAVGDSKQSIYAFRGSDVAVFNRALAEVPARNAPLRDRPQSLPWGLTCADSAERRSGIVRLEHNYRTARPVLELGNEVFRRLFARSSWRDFDARPQDMIHGGEASEGAGVEFHLLGDSGDPDRRSDDEAELVALRVSELQREGVKYADIAVLVRRRTRNSQFRAAFARHNLPLLVFGEGGLLETQEALDCVNLLRALADPTDDLAMLGLLRSPMGGVSDAELTALSLAGAREAPLIERVGAWPGKSGAAVRLLGLFSALRARVGRDAPALLLAEALAETGYALAIGCGPDAEQRLANLERIAALVQRMQRETPSLAPLARELRDRIERGDDETQGVPAADVDGVRLMTIHRAKGLEFPIVFVPDLGSDPRGGDSGPLRQLPASPGKPLGLHLKSLDEADRGEWRCDFAAWQAGREQAQRAEAEEKRLIYVAWTRAKRRLVLSGSVDAELRRDRWAQQLLASMGVTAHGQQSADPRVQLVWHQSVPRANARPHRAAILAARDALASGALPLPAGLDTTLVAPVGAPAEVLRAPDPAALEIGTQVHAEMERMLRARDMQAGVHDPRVHAHVSRAREALSTLAHAKHELPEFEIMTPHGPRRLDLLRELDGGRYEIIDYKTDLVTTSLREHAESEHGGQLRAYGQALTAYLTARGRPVAGLRLLVCFTAPDGLRASDRLVEIPT